MKIVIWLLNIVQVVIVYFILYALYFYGILEFVPEETGLNFKSLFPILSLFASVSLWKIYNKISVWIISDLTQAKVSEIKTAKSNVMPSKLLYTFFFGYFALKWRRLIRTISIIIASPVLIYNINQLIKSGRTPGEEEGLALILVIFIPILLSWIIKPFKVN